MKVFFKPSFIRDFNDLPPDIRREVKRIAMSAFPRINTIQEFNEFSLKPLKGFKGYYRIKMGDYRIGFKTENGAVIFMRVKHRKDIYKHFP